MNMQKDLQRKGTRFVLRNKDKIINMKQTQSAWQSGERVAKPTHWLYLCQ